MVPDIVDGPIGVVGGYDLEFKEGKLMFVVKINWKGLILELHTGADSDAVIEALKAAIPGQIDDAILDVAKAGLKLVK